MTVPETEAEFRAALVQLCAGRDVGKNIDTAAALIREAASRGARYIQTPEVTTFMDTGSERLFAVIEPEENNKALAHFLRLARELRVWLHIGSMAVLTRAGKAANRSFLITPDGDVAARYDKIHMFDVSLPGGETYRESDSYEPGQTAVLANLPWGGLGMTICYDLRFPYLYRALARAGARFIAVPSAFTKVTGEAHWHTLLRARAIEAQCFVFAANQGGMHEHGRETFGHSLIISPWGEILAEAGVQPAVILADIKCKEADDVRGRVPSLTHDRDFKLNKIEMSVKSGTPS